MKLNMEGEGVADKKETGKVSPSDKKQADRDCRVDNRRSYQHHLPQIEAGFCVMMQMCAAKR